MHSEGLVLNTNDEMPRQNIVHGVFSISFAGSFLVSKIVSARDDSQDPASHADPHLTKLEVQPGDYITSCGCATTPWTFSDAHCLLSRSQSQCHKPWSRLITAAERVRSTRRRRAADLRVRFFATRGETYSYPHEKPKLTTLLIDR